MPAPGAQSGDATGLMQPEAPPTGDRPPSAAVSYAVSELLKSVPAATVLPCAAMPWVAQSVVRASVHADARSSRDDTQPALPGWRVSAPEPGSRSSTPIVWP